ncbi:hypothetical protein [Methylobacterium oryzae]|uniref:hypothetical protein n=1 Tax=Methylobacterium oryzae TaxID=334852 RepID=UPI001F40F457|nr:hypothetical protein [Methylobacterium oryzae]UIN38411.1 hypothetical protein LXM90_30985 [Methylobacterium oryzae]
MLTRSNIKGNRAPADHLEVRCDETGRLLGWISGIRAALVPPDELLEFVADPDGMVIEDEDGVQTQGLMSGVQVDEFEARFTDYRTHAALDHIHAIVPEYARRSRLEGVQACVYTWTAAVVSPQEAEELFDFDNFVPFGEADGALMAEEALFHSQGKPAAPMPKAAPLKVPGSLLKPASAAPAISTLGKVTGPVSDLASVLVNAKMPVSELGKTLNQLGAAYAKAGSEMQKAMDRALGKALTGR